MRQSLILLLLGMFILTLGPASVAQETDDAAAAWSRISEVVTHPRCANCHVGAEGRPIWSGPSYEKAYGLEKGGWMHHGMFIHGGESRIGAENVPCSTCHMEENSDVAHGPPGAHVWLLPPVEMEWFGKSGAEICRQLKDPAQNGGRSLEAVADHIARDDLVHWGWKPGGTREPAPYSREQIAADLRVWAGANAPCPDLPITDAGAE